MTRFEPCEQCRDSIHPGYLEYAVRGYVGRGAKKLVECDCHAAWRDVVKGERLLSESGLPDYTYSIDGYLGDKSRASLEALKKLAREFPKNKEFQRAFVYVYGPNGCQKTVVVDWVGKELCKRGVSVKFVPVSELSEKLRRSFVDDGSKVDLDYLQAADFLILDEMFDTRKTAVTDWFIPFLDAFLRERVEYRKKAVLTMSNVAPNDISPKFGESLKNFVVRHTKGSTLRFLDDYWAVYDGDVSVAYDASKGLFG